MQQHNVNGSLAPALVDAVPDVAGGGCTRVTRRAVNSGSPSSFLTHNLPTGRKAITPESIALSLLSTGLIPRFMRLQARYSFCTDPSQSFSQLCVIHSLTPMQTHALFVAL